MLSTLVLGIFLLTLEVSLIRNEITFDRYWRYDEIQDYLQEVSRHNKHLINLENFGVSHENRHLTSLQISTGSNGERPLIFLDAGVHAREWLAPAQSLYIINQLVENPNNKKLIEDVDWIIIPLVNPDGYEYTHTTDRLWRKNRAKGKQCDGVDLNRNFDFHWSQSNIDECSKFYPGTYAFSEPESQALSRIILQYANRTKLYLSLHTAAQAFLYPFGDSTNLPENDAELYHLGIAVSEAVFKINKTKYNVGRSTEIVNSGPGTSRDWAYDGANIKLAYTIELEAYVNTTFEHRFEMPPERILGVVSEMFEGIKVFHSYIKNKYT